MIAGMTRAQRTLYSALGLTGFLLFWELSLRSGLLPGSLVPLPSSIPGVLWLELLDGIWLDVVRSSLSHYSVGVLLGSTLGIAAQVQRCTCLACQVTTTNSAAGVDSLRHHLVRHKPFGRRLHHQHWCFLDQLLRQLQRSALD